MDATQLAADLATRIDNEKRELKVILAGITYALGELNKRLTKLEE